MKSFEISIILLLSRIWMMHILQL